MWSNEPAKLINSVLVLCIPQFLEKFESWSERLNARLDYTKAYCSLNLYKNRKTINAENKSNMV